jgi:hypothetical protein
MLIVFIKIESTTLIEYQFLKYDVSFRLEEEINLVLTFLFELNERRSGERKHFSGAQKLLVDQE